METKGRTRAEPPDAPPREVSFHQRTGDRPAHAEQPLRGQRLVGCHAFDWGRRWVTWEIQKSASLDKRQPQARQLARRRNEIEQISVFARGGVTPLAGARAREAHVKALPRRIGDIANVPIAPTATTV